MGETDQMMAAALGQYRLMAASCRAPSCAKSHADRFAAAAQQYSMIEAVFRARQVELEESDGVPA